VRRDLAGQLGKFHRGLLTHLRRWKERKLFATCFVEFSGKPIASVKKGLLVGVGSRRRSAIDPPSGGKGKLERKHEVFAVGASICDHRSRLTGRVRIG
jgi:hypothetical protein